MCCVPRSVLCLSCLSCLLPYAYYFQNVQYPYDLTAPASPRLTRNSDTDPFSGIVPSVGTIRKSLPSENHSQAPLTPLTSYGEGPSAPEMEKTPCGDLAQQGSFGGALRLWSHKTLNFRPGGFKLVPIFHPRAASANQEKTRPGPPPLVLDTEGRYPAVFRSCHVSPKYA
jgi:hypothetical protein